MRGSQVFSQAVNAAATFTGTAQDVGKGGTGPQGLYLDIRLPQAPTGTAPVLDVFVETSDTSAFTVVRESLQYHQDLNAKGHYWVRLITSNKWYRIVAVAGGTTPNFGTVTVHEATGPQAGGQQDPF